jgi:glycosyltransferase involved in cell wall biosynthesis
VGTFREAIESRKIPYYALPIVLCSQVGRMRVMLNHFLMLYRIHQILAREKPDLMHVNSSDGLMYTSLPCRLQRVPLIWHPHLALKQLTKRSRIAQWWFAQIKMDFVIFISDYVRKTFASFPISASASEVVYNSLDITPFRRSQQEDFFRQQYSLSSEMRLVGLAGRIAPGKGHLEFLSAARRVIETIPNVKFLIVGDAQLQSLYSQEVQQRIEDLALKEHVIFTGFVQPNSRVMCSLDIVVVPSYAEPFGMVVIEAMAAGTPVIGADAGALPEIITNGETGLLIPPRDEKALAEGIIRLLRDQELYQYLSNQALKLVLARFTIDEYIHKIMRIYDNLSQRKASWGR